jgi:cyclopropane fatty-acyl-phospholipid synthase-like methyltransferase
MEIQPPLLERMEKQGFSVVSGPLTSQSLSGRMFDVIAAFDVLEHLTVHEILDLLLNSRDHLKPDGFYLFQFPNMASPFGMIHQHGDVTHKTPLSVSVIDQIARTTGFRVTTTLRPRPYPQRTMAKMRRLLGYALQAVIEIVISHAYFGGAAHLEPNALVVLQRKPD